ncbi:RDD family protein [Streptomyces sp. NPDC058294]|uniref:RDD family protein n=1 Tax=Streptomyces sp. NPDC058294 TaxID=3346430 RepID=UPI0036E0ACC7
MTTNPGESRGTGTKPGQRWSARPRPASAAALAAPTALAPRSACTACGQATGIEPCCQSCGQVLFLPRGLALSTPGLRFGGYLLEAALFVCTLGIGWFIWAFIVFQQGQTPAKQLLHMRVVHITDAGTARWGRMFFREFLAKGIIGVLAYFTLFVPYFWLLWDRNGQELWDKMATTLVVTDPADRLRSPSPDHPTEADAQTW